MNDGTRVIRAYFAAFNAGDIDGMLACLGDDVVHDVNQGERRTGKPAFADFCRHMERCYREQLHDIVVMSDESGERLSAEFIVDGTYLADDEGLPPARGQTYRLAAASLFAFRDGLIRRVTTYYNLADWTRQVAG